MESISLQGAGYRCKLNSREILLIIFELYKLSLKIAKYKLYEMVVSLSGLQTCYQQLTTCNLQPGT